MDISLNSNFDAHLDDRHDLGLTTDLDEFEQSVAIRVTAYMHHAVLGETGRSNIEERIRLQVTRAARDHETLDDVAAISIAPKETEPDTYEVQVQYIGSHPALTLEVDT